MFILAIVVEEKISAKNAVTSSHEVRLIAMIMNFVWNVLKNAAVAHFVKLQKLINVTNAMKNLVKMLKVLMKVNIFTVKTVVQNSTLNAEMTTTFVNLKHATVVKEKTCAKVVSLILKEGRIFRDIIFALIALYNATAKCSVK
jgi:hypothetical protein